MNCEGCNKEVGDIKSLRTHRKSCAKYAAWDALFTPIARIEPVVLTYEGRTLPRLF